MRALITGGKGFVGHWLAAHLKDSGDDVVAIDIETDISDGPALRKVVAKAAPEAIYHLAAMTTSAKAGRTRARCSRSMCWVPRSYWPRLATCRPPRCPGRQFGRGLRRRQPGAASPARGHPDCAGDPLRSQQAGS